MMSASRSLKGKVALVTGAARRIGAAICRCLHAQGAAVAVHYRGSAAEAAALCAALNALRPDSALAVPADLADIDCIPALIDTVTAWHGRLDILINNASSFYPTPLGTITAADWDDLVGSNLKAPLFLTQAALDELRKAHGVIINMIDIHAQRPLRDHAVYSTAKAGLAMLTRALARDLAPEIRVNGVAPGAIMWPEGGMSEQTKATILRQIPAGRPGDPSDIADCVLYLVRDATYVTGQIIAVDGGRSIGW
jgi:pteridine reductase